MRLSSLLVPLAFATTPLAGVAAQTVDATIDRAVAAWDKVKTVRGSFEQTVTNSLMGTSATSRGEYVQERPNRLAIRFAAPMTDAIVADGQVVWIYLPSSNPGQVLKRPATDRSALPIDLTAQFLESPRTKYDITAAGTRTIDGHPAHGLVLVPKNGVSAPFTKATVWVGDDDALVREFEFAESNGVTRKVHITKIEVNPPVSRSSFAFAVPKDVKVVDQTKP
jgi:outer membrane lipoprotein carrier protein